jgi:hypothetical protein
MSKNKNQLEALFDREAIRDLPLRYCDYVWRNDIDGLVQMFAKDGEFIIAADGKETGAKGQAELREIYEQGLAIEPRPFIHNHVIELLSDKKARGRCYLDLRSAKHNMDIIGAGHYADTYVKVKGEWKFQRRHFTALRFDVDPVATPQPAKPARTAKSRKRAAPAH